MSFVVFLVGTELVTGSYHTAFQEHVVASLEKSTHVSRGKRRAAEAMLSHIVPDCFVLATFGPHVQIGFGCYQLDLGAADYVSLQESPDSECGWRLRLASF